jgi:diaminohydroxyphosphoribosylaminopyrimidine deaminase/5-amino-6-(5-phosphoribosylamino)uracil reductase
LVAAGAARVIVGAVDPNPLHRGRGLDLLRAAGITVTHGVLAAECAALNPEFHHAMTTGLPWVIAKCGMSLDGRLTRPPGEPQWLTSPAARRDAMLLRARVDAILVGAETVRQDDPSLTLRPRRSNQPWRVVWAPRQMPPATARIFHDNFADRTLVLRHKTLRAALRSLAARGMLSVLVEGGGHTLGCVMDQELAREVVFYVAPLLAGGGVPAVGGRGRPDTASALRLENTTFKRIGDCVRVSGRLRGQ